MQPTKHEAHITFPIEAADAVGKLAVDVVMGKRVYCYLSAYGTDARRLLESTRSVAAVATLRGVPPLRMKVEAILYDSKTGVDLLSSTINT